MVGQRIFQTNNQTTQLTLIITNNPVNPNHLALLAIFPLLMAQYYALNQRHADKQSGLKTQPQYQWLQPSCKSLNLTFGFIMLNTIILCLQFMGFYCIV